MMHEIRENTELMTGQFHNRSVLCNRRGSRIQCDVSAMKLGDDLPGCAANQGAKTSEDFLHSKRLRHVIVRAAIDALNFFVPASSCCQDQDRHSDAGFPPSSENGEAVHFRKTQVEKSGIVGFGLAEKIRSLAVVGTVHSVAGALDGIGELFSQPRLIL